MSIHSNLYAQTENEITYPSLNGPHTADVIIIGGGITGLSTALHLSLAQRSVIVLESEQPGWGASGRNGGQVNPGLKTSPDTVERDFGPVFGPRLVKEAWEAPDLVFDLIDRYKISCHPARGGTIRAAQKPSQLPALQTLAKECALRGSTVSMLSAEEISTRTGTRHYCGGMIDFRGGQVDPLAYTRGLAVAASQEGAKIFGSSVALSLRQEGASWHVQTAQGSIQAPRVIFATNGYTDRLWPKLRRSIVPVYSAIISSRPLSEQHRQKILANHEVVYEMGDITTYYRVNAEGRLLIGGRSKSRDMIGPKSFPYLMQHARKLWHDLDNNIWTNGWNGQLAITPDHYPHWHQPSPGIIACLGYNGRGVAMATTTGRALAEHLTENAPPLFPFSRIRPIRGHAVWKQAVTARINWGRLMDRLAK